MVFSGNRGIGVKVKRVISSPMLKIPMPFCTTGKLADFR